MNKLISFYFLFSHLTIFLKKFVYYTLRLTKQAISIRTTLPPSINPCHLTIITQNAM